MSSNGAGARFVPDLELDKRATPPVLIEPPIILKSTTATTTGVVEAKKI